MRLNDFKINEDAKMAKATDEKIIALLMQFSKMDLSSPANEFMFKRVRKEFKKRNISLSPEQMKSFIDAQRSIDKVKIGEDINEADQYSASNSRALMVQLDNMHTQMQKKVEEIYATDNGDLQDQITTMLKVLDNLNAVIARSMKVIPAAEYDPTESVQEGDDYRDGHDINLLKAVAKQFAEDLGNSDYTAIDELLKNVPESDMRAYLPLGRSEMESVQEDMDPKGPEVTIGDYTTKNFYMCGGAIDTAEKFPDNEGMEKLIRLQDLMFGLEADVMNGMEATDEVIEFGTELTDAIMDQAKVAGIEKEVEEYQPMHLAAIKTGDPEPGYGRVDTEEED
jgi:hypothetical protein